MTHATRIHQTIGPLIPNGAPLALFDFPNYSNVGDSAIWLGTTEYLKRHHPDSPIVWVSDRTLANIILPDLPQETVVLINGGGNLGDLWPTLQALRERVIRHYPRHRVVQLPQSIHFQEAGNLDRCRMVFSDHPDFHLIVRDHESLRQAKDLYARPTYLCPDMALCLDLKRERTGTLPIVALMRDDKERATPLRTAKLGDVYRTDWLDEPQTLAQKADRVMLRYPNRTRKLRPHVYHRLATERLRRGCDILSSGKAVITDRLHAHILCTLLEIPHVVLDNSYRKIGNFMETWGTGSCARSFSDAVVAARRII